MAQFGKMAAWLAGGAVLGAGLGLLYAPQSGTETRRMIRIQAKKAQLEANRVGRRVKQGVERVKTVMAKHIPDIKAA